MWLPVGQNVKRRYEDAYTAVLGWKLTLQTETSAKVRGGASQSSSTCNWRRSFKQWARYTIFTNQLLAFTACMPLRRNIPVDCLDTRVPDAQTGPALAAPSAGSMDSSQAFWKEWSSVDPQLSTEHECSPICSLHKIREYCWQMACCASCEAQFQCRRIDLSLTKDQAARTAYFQAK